MRKLHSVGVVSAVNSRLVPLVPRLVTLFRAFGKRVGYPLWLAPAQQVYRDVGIYRQRVRREHKARTARNVGGLVCGAHNGRLRSRRGINVRPELYFNMCEPRAVIRLEQKVHDLPVRVGILRLVVHKQPRGVVSRDRAQPAENRVRVHVHGASVNGNVLVGGFHLRHGDLLFLGQQGAFRA